MPYRRPSHLAALSLAALLAACAHRAPEIAPTPMPAPPAAAPAPDGVNASADVALLRSRQLMVPVSGIEAARIPDSFHDARDGARVHRAVDIMAPRGTAVLSADSGSVLRVSSNRLGGLTVYAVDPERRLVYYYAHLDRYVDSLRAGMPLAKGQLIGYVGTTGNAPPDTPHLHFQVMRMDDPKHYWEGTPLDPRPYFAAAGRAMPPAVVPVSLGIALPSRPSRATSAGGPSTPASRSTPSSSRRSAGRAATP
jgi:murein DD-endopeptidase MepM/ murein hydrolase activator NlpD